MAPSATEPEPQTEVPVHPGKAAAAKPWVKSTGALEQYEHIELTPVIGREYPHVNLVSLLQAPNSEELLRELALTSRSPLLHTNKQLSNIISLPTRSRLLPIPRQLDCRLAERAHPKNWPRGRKTKNIRTPHPPNPQLGPRRLPHQ